MSDARPPRDAGLRAIREVREERKRSKVPRMTGTTWLVGGTGVALALLIAWWVSGSSLRAAKVDLHSKQRAAVATVGAEWSPLRDRLEGIAVESARTFDADFVAPEMATWDFRSLPGIYLRLRQADARDVPTLRQHALESAKDAFTSCLMRQNNPTIAAIAAGEQDAGAVASVAQQDQPWNLRQGYAATRILGDAWVDQMKAAEDPIHLRPFELSFEKSVKEEIPVAIDMIKRAQFYLLVLDEDVDEARELADAGRVDEGALQQVVHPVRVRIVDLKRNADVARLKVQGEADAVMAQGTVTDPGARAAMKRQVMNCALANVVWSKLRP